MDIEKHSHYTNSALIHAYKSYAITQKQNGQTAQNFSIAHMYNIMSLAIRKSGERSSVH